MSEAPTRESGGVLKLILLLGLGIVFLVGVVVCAGGGIIVTRQAVFHEAERADMARMEAVRAEEMARLNADRARSLELQNRERLNRLMGVPGIDETDRGVTIDDIEKGLVLLSEYLPTFQGVPPPPGSPEDPTTMRFRERWPPEKLRTLRDEYPFPQRQKLVGISVEAETQKYRYRPIGEGEPQVELIISLSNHEGSWKVDDVEVKKLPAPQP